MKQHNHEIPSGTAGSGCSYEQSAELRPIPEAAFERAARLFRALGDPPRLRILHLLLKGEVCVSEIVTALHEKFPTISQRLRILRTEGLVTRRREKSHVYYTLADEHVKSLVSNALAHADELDGSLSLTREQEDDEMSCETHANHTHQHGPGCGHTAVQHGDHVCYLHDGHLHHPAGTTVEEHVLEVNSTNPGGCTTGGKGCGGHDASHKHAPGCGHETVPHGDHVCYIVDGRLHYQHGDHCDDHGPVALVK